MILIERGGDLVAVPDDFDFGPVYLPRTMAFEAPWQTRLRERGNAARNVGDVDELIAAEIARSRAPERL
ncbi:hypothetical protein [Streptomyces griseus]|uniref:hypothetical protein n=1 Tax=Streptomyces griseus TaxID=1911 RepID=UPI0004C784AD|nr:hypothetical protein [Streptomyces griseus]